jgi:hypothetical protein
VSQFVLNLITFSYLFKFFIVGQIIPTIFNMIINCVVVIYSHIYSHLVLIMVVVKIMTMTEVQILLHDYIWIVVTSSFNHENHVLA